VLESSGPLALVSSSFVLAGVTSSVEATGFGGVALGKVVEGLMFDAGAMEVKGSDGP
jgi:hypothetical protein